MAKDLFSSHPPITPPTTEEGRLSWLRLIRSPRVGASTFHRLMDDHRCADAALDALIDVARAAGVRGYRPCPAERAESELDAARRCGARMLCHGDPDYPEALAAIPDPPPVLWLLGDPALLGCDSVALVGARNASSLGVRMARRLAEGLGHAGFSVVSGLARGVDAAAHKAALPTGTVAVMAGGVDRIYPTENTALYQAIAETGALLSEQPMGMAPQARHFPRRNRIVAGLARAVVVVEAAEKSGTLITAADALDLGREVMAVPGHPADGRAAGCNRLIREGATLIRGAEDVLTALGPPARAARRADPADAVTHRSPTAPGGAGHAAPRLTEAASRPVTGAATDTPPTPPRAGEGACPAASRRCTTVTPSPNGAAARPARSGDGPAPAGAESQGPRPAPAVAAPVQVVAGSAPDAALRDGILDRLGPSPLAEDQLIRDLAQPAARVLPELVALELDGRILRHPGGLLSLA